MRQRKTLIWAIISGLFAVGCLVLAALAWREGIRASRQFGAWSVAEPVRMPVDLSVAGEYHAQFHQICSVAHGEGIELRVSPPFESAQAAQAALSGLEGKFTVSGPGGEEVLSEELRLPDLSSRWDPHEGVELVYFWPFKNGDYECVVRITRPAANLKDRRPGTGWAIPVMWMRESVREILFWCTQRSPGLGADR